MPISVDNWYKDEISYRGDSELCVKHPSISEPIIKKCLSILTFRSDGTNNLDLNFNDEQELFFKSKPSHSFLENIDVDLEISTLDGIFKGKGKTQFLNTLFRTQEPGSISIDWYKEVSFDTGIIKNPNNKIYFFAPITNLKRENLISWANIKTDKLLLKNQTWYLFFKDNEFEFYIQPLTDISKRLQLIKGQSLATSFIAGETTYKNFNDIIYIVRIVKMILSFSSGRNLGVPFVEIRDSVGKVIKRIHLKEQYYPYYVIDSVIIPSYSTQKLLTTCILSIMPNIENRDIIINNFEKYINSLLFANNQSIPLKYKMTRLLIAFEDYCHDEGIAVPSKLENIFKDTYSKLEEIINRCVSNLKAVNNLDNNQREHLRFIIRNCEKLLKMESNIQVGLNRIIKDTDFLDKAILDKVIKKEFKNNNSPNSWDDLIRSIRNSLVHDDSLPSYLKGKEDFIEKIYWHFIDFFIRIILKKMNFNGEYRSMCNPNSYKVDWVKKDPKNTVSAKDLGFY